MDWYEKIKSYYDAGLWSAEWVRDAVTKGKLTQEQADDILGEGAV